MNEEKIIDIGMIVYLFSITVLLILFLWNWIKNQF